MKRNITGKQINNWAANVNNLPHYWGDKFNWDCNKGKYVNIVKGEFIAKKYNAIVQLIEERKASVNVYPNSIHIEYTNGNCLIDRDILTDNFLLPLININFGFQSVKTK